MRIINIILFLVTLISCTKDNTEGVPSFIKIDSIKLNEEGITSNITDAWVYIDNNKQGIYELPVQFPVLAEGIKEIKIRPGIKVNGIAANRTYYHFYSSYTEDIELVPGEVYNINPTTNYKDNTLFFSEDFQGIGLKIDTTSNSDTDFLIVSENNTNFAYGKLTDSIIDFEIATEEIILPKNGSPVFLELDYKANTEFLIGVYVNEPNLNLVITEEMLWVTTKEEWNKIYVNLTPIMNNYNNAETFKIFIKMERDFNILENTICFDNIKIVY